MILPLKSKQSVIYRRYRYRMSLCLTLTILIATFISACQVTENKYDDIGAGNAFVYGQITTQSGAPVYRAKVVLRHYSQGCNVDTTQQQGLEYEYTSEAGKYMMLYHINSLEDSSCFKARIELPDTSSLVVPEPKIFDGHFRSSPPYDSVRVDFILQYSTPKNR